jgi:antitoxin ParD1/3/4
MSETVKKSFAIGAHFDRFIVEQVTTGRFANQSEVVRAGLRLLEDQESRLLHVRALIAEADAEIGQGKGLKFDTVESLTAAVHKRSADKSDRKD